jgi:hypothetical protein
MMKCELRVALLSLLLLLPVAGSGGKNHPGTSLTEVAKSTRTLDVNRLNLQITDRGNLLTNVTGEGGGMWWFNGTSREWVVYDQGPWIIGKINGSPAMGNAYWGTSYLPGGIIDGRPAVETRPADSIRFHPYRISRTGNPSDPDLLNWPADLGAPVDLNGNPLLLGDELVWSAFNDADGAVQPYDWKPTNLFPHMPVEIQQSFYARTGSRSDTSLLANSAFMEWTFINKGTAVIESCYVGLWTDLDVTDPLWNPFGVDTITQSGYCWDSSPWDSMFYEPKAVGYTLLYGPRVPDASSSAIYKGRRIEGYRNLSLSSFWGMRSDYGPGLFAFGPNTIEEAWNIARGYDKAGNVIIDSATRAPTRFPWSGDPLKGTGWIYRDMTEGEAGFLFFTGPFTFAPGDTQWTMIGLLPAASFNKLDAIRAVRNNAARLHTMTYQEIALPMPLAVQESAHLPSGTRLLQNYPNPFNPLTIIKFTVGGNRGQGLGVSDVSIVVYDVLGREIRVLVNEKRQPGSYQVTFDGTGLASGVYLYRLTAGSFVQCRTMVLVR